MEVFCQHFLEVFIQFQISFNKINKNKWDSNNKVVKVQN